MKDDIYNNVKKEFEIYDDINGTVKTLDPQTGEIKTLDILDNHEVDWARDKFRIEKKLKFLDDMVDHEIRGFNPVKKVWMDATDCQISELKKMLNYIMIITVGICIFLVAQLITAFITPLS